jgi:hypothetical protein
MNSPYARPVRLTNDDYAAWAAYEAKNRAAREQYEVLPIAHCHEGEGSPCQQCHRRNTRHKDGICPTCRRDNAAEATKNTHPNQGDPTMTDLDTDTARIVAKLAELNAHIADLTSEAESLKAELRSLPAGDHIIDGRPALRIVPTRRFDAAKGLELVPEPLRGECYVTTLDAAKVKSYLAPALQEMAMVEAGKPKVVLL